MKIAIASDHAGFDLKEEVKEFLKKNHEVIDFGTKSRESCDFSDFVYPAALSVAEMKAERAILIDGAGYPSAAIANRIRGISAAVCQDSFCAKLAREHSNTNVLCLGGKIIGSGVALDIIQVWLTTPFLGGRYEKRLNKVRELSEKHLKDINQISRKLLSLDDLKNAILNRESIIIDEKTIITPALIDAIKDLR